MADSVIPTIEEQFFMDCLYELQRARAKFPHNAVQHIALSEEVGELAEALMDKPWAEVRKEAIQTAVMAARVAIDGDDSVLELRRSRGLDTLS